MHDIARAAADAARIPDFADLQRRGERRRNVRTGLAAGAAALAVAGILGATQLLGGDGGEDISPAPSPAPSETTHETESTGPTGAAAIIDHPDAQVVDAAVTPGDVDNRAVVWRVVDKVKHGLAITDDGFITRTDVLLPHAADVVAGVDGRFLVRDRVILDRLWVTDVGGELVRVQVSGAEAPVGPGEVVVWIETGLVAVDTGTGAAHPVPMSPGGDWEVREHAGRLTATSTHISSNGDRTSTYHWSDDGGATWQRQTFEPGELGNAEVVPTPAGSEHVVLLLGDGATIGPLTAVLTMPAEGGGFTTTEYDGEQTSQSGAFVVDGELRLLADRWGDGTGPPTESGLYRWDAGTLVRIAVDDPDPTAIPERTLVATDTSEAAPVRWVAAGDELFESANGGLAWDELRAR